jgi:3-O-methylgallate 3,4-dioxygenase
MAEIVLGIASSHGPQLNIPPEQWSVLQEKDEHDRRMDYEALRLRARPGLEAEVRLEVWQRRYQRCMGALYELAEVVQKVRPDVLVIIGDDQHEQFLDDNMPMFSIYWGDAVLVKKRPPRNEGIFGRVSWHEIEQSAFPDEPAWYPAHPPLAKHLIEYLRCHDVDVATSKQLREDVGVGHAFAFFYRRILPAGVSVPVVPFMVNTFYPPNQPTPGRCYEVGRRLAEAIAAWPESARVAIMASGGLSHVVLNEELDHVVLRALQEKDAATLVNLPEEQLNLGTSEIRCWITAAGALEKLAMQLVAYEPCYRSLAGTGCGMAFATWQA